MSRAPRWRFRLTDASTLWCPRSDGIRKAAHATTPNAVALPLRATGIFDVSESGIFIITSSHDIPTPFIRRHHDVAASYYRGFLGVQVFDYRPLASKARTTRAFHLSLPISDPVFALKLYDLRTNTTYEQCRAPRSCPAVGSRRKVPSAVTGHVSKLTVLVSDESRALASSRYREQRSQPRQPRPPA